MDDTLDIPIMNSYWCGICHQDIPVDDRSPNGLMRHLCIWDLFRKVANYYGMYMTLFWEVSELELKYHLKVILIFFGPPSDF